MARFYKAEPYFALYSSDCGPPYIGQLIPLPALRTGRITYERLSTRLDAIPERRMPASSSRWPALILLVAVLAHVSIQCADPAASRAFYEAVLQALAASALLTFGDHVGFGNEGAGPVFWIVPVNTPGGPHDDVHIAFRARSCAEVDAFVEVARSRGAEVLHEPKEWWYRPGYYGGFVRDPDGNNVEAVHLPG